jgi:hypothetical protein
MGTVTSWPLSPVPAESEVFARVRLLIDLDEATDPGALSSVLVVIGLVPRPDTGPDAGAAAALEGLQARIADIVVERAAIYRTRSTEICMLVDGTLRTASALLRRVQGAIDDVGLTTPQLSIGMVSLPNEASDAVVALTLADDRMMRGELVSH